MDFILIVILMAVLYLVPEMLRQKRKPKQYEYPDIPQPEPKLPKEKPGQVETVSDKIAESVMWMKPLTAPADGSSVSAAKANEEISATQGRFTQEVLVNGFIFAEIIRPPRAYRPLRR